MRVASWSLLATTLAVLAVEPSATSGATPQIETPRPITAIRIERAPVFDPSELGPLAPLGRAANWVHVDTRAGVIRDLLLFREGDLATPALAAESARVLRESGLFVDADVRLIARGDSVDVVVTTRDAWSTQLIVSYSRDADNDTFVLGGVETNFLGRGDALAGSHTWSDEEDRFAFALTRRRFLGPRGRLSVSYFEGDDGYGRGASLSRGYYSDLTRWSGGVFGSSYDGDVYFYVGGDKSARYDTNSDYAYGYLSIYGDVATSLRISEGAPTGAARAGSRRIRRWGLGASLFLDDRRSRAIADSLALEDITGLALRHDRRRQVSVGATWLARRFTRTRGIDRSGTIEDVPLGTRAGVVVGMELEALGSTRDRPYAAVTLLRTTPWRDGVVSARLHAAGHFRHGAPSGREASAVLKTFMRPSRGTVTVARALWHAGWDFAPEEILYLGARSALRGHRFRALRGTRAVVVNLEQRWNTGLRLGVVNLGLVGFVDAGNVWPADDPVRLADVEVDVGFGLRLSDPNLLPIPLRIDLARDTTRGDPWRLSITSGQFFSAIPSLDFTVPIPGRFGSSLE